MDNRDFSKPVKEIYPLLPPEQKKMMEPQFDLMVDHVKQTGRVTAQ